MADVGKTDPPKSFAHAFGDALNAYLKVTGMGQSEVARLLGIEGGEGEKRKGGARIHRYCRDAKDGTRPKPGAEILYLACTKLPGFSLEYRGYRISAATLNGKGSKPSPPIEQTSFDFEHQFNLTGKQGTVELTVKRPPGRIEVSLSLDARVPGGQ